MLSCDSNGHLLKVDINGIVQDALAVCFIHHDEGVHLQEESGAMTSWKHFVESTLFSL